MPAKSRAKYSVLLFYDQQSCRQCKMRKTYKGFPLCISCHKVRLKFKNGNKRKRNREFLTLIEFIVLHSAIQSKTILHSLHSRYSTILIYVLSGTQCLLLDFSYLFRRFFSDDGVFTIFYYGRGQI